MKLLRSFLHWCRDTSIALTVLCIMAITAIVLIGMPALVIWLAIALWLEVRQTKIKEPAPYTRLRSIEATEPLPAQDAFMASDDFQEWILEARKENPNISLKDAIMLFLEEQFFHRQSRPLEDEA